MKQPSRIFLVGLPGAGKSTVGKYMASELGYAFIDLDERIEAQAGQPIRVLFQQSGEQHFREMERDALRAITETNVVVATGGGAPCFHDNMDWMNTNGFTLFLNPSLDIIAERISKETHRPLIGEKPRESLEALLNQRITFYEKSGMESGRIEPCEILAELLRFINES